MTTKKIMIVEDESVISLDIKSSLIKMGYEVCGIAATGESALMKIASTQPDLVLMDIHLKGEMTGIEVSEKVKSDFQIPIVYLTANADSSTFQEAKGTDPYGYLLKPFEEKELGIMIEVVLNKHTKEQVIRSSERWYASAFQSFSEAVIATDQNGCVVYMNVLAESMTGCALTEVLDRPLTEVLTFYRKIQQFDQVDLKESIGSILNAALRGKEGLSLPHEARILTKHRSIVPVEGTATSLRDSLGHVIGSLFVFRQTKEMPTLAAQAGSGRQAQKGEIADSDEKMQTLGKQKTALESKDIALIESFIKAFINQRPTMLSTPRLVANGGENNATLSDRTDGAIMNVKLINDKLTAIVQQKSRYWELIRHLLIENSFFPVSRRTNGTCYYQHRPLPERCQIYHTSGNELWEAWHGHLKLNTPAGLLSKQSSIHKISRESILVLRRGSWYHIQSFVMVENSLRIKTVGGEIYLTPDDLLVWGVQDWALPATQAIAESSIDKRAVATAIA